MMFANYPAIDRLDLSSVDAETQKLAKDRILGFVDRVAGLVEKDGIFSAWEVNPSLLACVSFDADGKPTDSSVRDAAFAAIIGAWIFQNRTTDCDDGFLYALPFLEKALEEKGFSGVPSLFRELDSFYIERSVGLGRTFMAVLFPGFVDTRRRGLLEGARGSNPDDGLVAIAGWFSRTIAAGHGVPDAESYAVLSKTAGWLKSAYSFL